MASTVLAPFLMHGSTGRAVQVHLTENLSAKPCLRSEKRAREPHPVILPYHRCFFPTVVPSHLVLLSCLWLHGSIVRPSVLEMLIEDELRPFIELPPALASKAQEELREPVCPKQCCSRVQELLNRLQDAGLGPDTPWMCGRAQAHAVMYLRCGQGPMPACRPPPQVACKQQDHSSPQKTPRGYGSCARMRAGGRSGTCTRRSSGFSRTPSGTLRPLATKTHGSGRQGTFSWSLTRA